MAISVPVQCAINAAAIANSNQISTNISFKDACISVGITLLIFIVICLFVLFVEWRLSK